MLFPFDFLRGIDELVDAVHRAQMGGEFMMDDATYRAAYDKIYGAYEQTRDERLKAGAVAQAMNPVRVSPAMPGVQLAASKAQRVLDDRVVSDLTQVERDLAGILTSMHAAFVSGLEQDAARAGDIRAAAAALDA